MATPESPKRKTLVARPDKVALEKAKAKALARVKAEEQVRLKAGEASPEPPQAAVEQERQTWAEAEQAKVETESTLAEVKKATEVETEKVELPLPAPGEGGAEQRVSFVVRLTVDERGQPRRTEVEHAQSGKKETFPALDAQRLATFMQACLSPSAIPEPSTPPVPPPAKLEAPIPETPRSVASLTLSDVRVFRMGDPASMALTLNPTEAFVVQTRFELQGLQAPALTAQASSYEMHVYAHEVTSGTSKLLTSYRGNLVGDVLEYTTQMQSPGLSPGLYRLVTLVTLQEPAKMIGHYEGPIIQVVGVEQPTPGLLISHT
ncbi:MAG: hypothetical protein HYR94_21425 [Chloroflexi bacterium]|nr:hypothetical protein [Chloroflexota bacterium]